MFNPLLMNASLLDYTGKFELYSVYLIVMNKCSTHLLSPAHLYIPIQNVDDKAQHRVGSVSV